MLHSAAYVVTDADTAIAMGSGDVPVLATPRLIAWLEAATVQAAHAFLHANHTSVGIEVRVVHRRATPIGGSIQVIATAPTHPDGRVLTFKVQAP